MIFVQHGRTHIVGVLLSRAPQLPNANQNRPATTRHTHFEVPPYSQQVALGSQVQMRCHPPKGKPAPTIKWLQNGSPISPLTDKNFIITGEGHLIVVNATLADTANYTCVAENVATKRLSAPATINVYGKAYLCKKNPFPFPPRKTNFPSNHRNHFRKRSFHV